MSLSGKINRMVHPLIIRWVLKTYNNKMDRRAQKYPDLFKAVNPKLTKAHLELWGRLGLPCNDKWLKFFTNLTGIEDYCYCPEDLYFARVERILNDCNRAGNECEDKNLIGLYVGEDVAPRAYLRYVRGFWFDGDGHGISEKEAADILSMDHGEIIGKVCIATSGGKGVSGYVFDSRQKKYVDRDGRCLTVDFIKGKSTSFVVQERIQQCDFEAQFNPASTNTFRIATLRCPWNGEIVVLKAGMRMGVGSAVIDNLSSGGISVAIDHDGVIDAHAYSWLDFKEFNEHPVSRIRFGGMKFPYFSKAVTKIKDIAGRNPNMNVLTWDIVIDKNENVRILEINASGISLDWMQFNFGSFFGKYTEGIVDWCARHRNMDEYAHFRSFYW